MKRSLTTMGVIVGLVTASAAFGDEWPQFRGPNRDGKSAETGLLKSWPAGGPKLLWQAKANLGIGYSSLAVTDDAIYTTGVFGEDGYVMALTLDGKPKWKAKYGREFTKIFLSSRTTPTIDDDRLYVMSGLGRIACLDTAGGKEKWAVDTAKAYGAVNIRWGMAESPLICDDKVICTPGGTKAGLVALDKLTGKEVWATNVGPDKSAYCSPIRIKDAARDLIATMMEDHVVGLDTADGKLLWKTPYAGPWRAHPNCPIHHNGRIYVTSGYDAGGLMLKLSDDGKSVTRLWTEKTLDTHHGGVLLIDGKLYGSSWIDNSKGAWLCVDWQTGKVLSNTDWRNKGSAIFADGMIYCFTEKTGTLALVKPDPTGWKPVSSFDVTQGSGKFWSHPAIANGILYIRHGEALMAYDIRAQK